MNIKLYDGEKNYDKFTINQIKMIELTRELDKEYEI